MKKILVLNIGLIFFSALHAQDKIISGVVPIRLKTADRTVDSVRKLLIPQDTTARHPTPKKPGNQLLKKPVDAIEGERNLKQK